jgi:hypothetical protein
VLFGGLATVKASAEQTGGGFSISEQEFLKGMATPLHSQPEATRRSTSSKGTSRSTSKTANL